MEVVEEANLAAVESCKKLVAVLSLPGGDPFRPMPVAAETDEAVARFGKVVAFLSDRLGHARARVGKRRPAPPVDASCLLDHPAAPMRSQEREAVAPAVLVSPACANVALTPANKKFDRNMFLETPLLELNSRSVLPSTAMAVQRQDVPKVAAVIPAPSPCTTTTHIQFQPQQQQQAKKQKSFQCRWCRCPGSAAAVPTSFDNNSVCTSSAATSFFTSISSQLISMVVRVPAISDKNADIPADNYSWRKYGQKPIKGSPHPRGYYRCSSKKDCPARKHVERCRSDAAMLIVTYENDHNHAQPLDPSPPPPQQQAKKQKSFQFDQTPSGEQFHIEVPVVPLPLPRAGGGGANEVISFSFDNNSVCTSSAATSFFTSMSSQLISMSDAATSSAATAAKKAACGKRGEDSGVKCHCPKKKKPREKRVVRVPAISDKNADIPADNYSWRKYGQKPIKGSPHPRGYYRCSSKKDCLARKHVERYRSDAAMLIVTYENDHNHAQPLDPSVLTANAEP
ncbi:hypothetical protein U9M48_010838 [Paspalum notatum var. saurae]|uniref:WRKY domain-containing protein n=1 Tax=Paspalum notatum var. saurae TaxID=547442 RepID=A0AAQ3SUB6_PASNO